MKHLAIIMNECEACPKPVDLRQKRTIMKPYKERGPLRPEGFVPATRGLEAKHGPQGLKKYRT